MRYSDFRIFLLIAAFGAASFFPGIVQAGPYLNSAHGNTTYGVSRLAGFAKGNCAHCHEQHASAGTEQGYLIFDQNNTDQARNFCFNCHGTGIGHVVNRSYSYRAGGWTADSLDNVKDAFSSLSLASSHNLADIVTFAAGMVGWKYTANSNACGVCHDPHVVQGDPLGKPNDTKGGLNPRGHVITQVNTSPVNLWGDNLNPDGSPNTIERMSNYPSYIDPYRNTVGPTYEPDGNTVQQGGANSVNYVAFCTTCHDDGTTNFGSRYLKTINWSSLGGEKHGQFNADIDIRMNGPYISGDLSLGYVLSCLDCHEPHGAENVFLIRGKVNGGVTTSANPSFSTSITSGNEFAQLCSQCHNPDPWGSGTDWDDIHHKPASLSSPDSGPYEKPASGTDCNNPAYGCHGQFSAPVTRINCWNCHYHGAKTGQVHPGTLGTIPLPNQTLGAIETF